MLGVEQYTLPSAKPRRSTDAYDHPLPELCYSRVPALELKTNYVIELLNGGEGETYSASYAHTTTALVRYLQFLIFYLRFTVA